MLVWPIAVLIAALWFTARNGPFIRHRHGKSLFRQFAEQLQLFLSDGVLPPWYYIFSLHDEGARRATTFIQRFEAKTCYCPPLKGENPSPLNDKKKFAEFCESHGIHCIHTDLLLSGRQPSQPLPDYDLFVKKIHGRGGRGAQRWDRVGPGMYAAPGGEPVSAPHLLSKLVEQSRSTPLLLQRRLRPHPGLAAITSGALPTLRILTCLDERGEPEIIAAMLRTSFGRHATVDNMHAGGIGALVDHQSGMLSRSSDLGSNARLGWFSVHPDTGAPIEGRVIPCWSSAKALAVSAHRVFNDRALVGWDVAILADGPILVEGNSNPCLDIMQRYMRDGFRVHRFTELLIHHLRARGVCE